VLKKVTLVIQHSSKIIDMQLDVIDLCTAKCTDLEVNVFMNLKTQETLTHTHTAY